MCEVSLSQVAGLLRPVSKEVFDGKGRLCLSTTYLNKLNSAFETCVGVDGNSTFQVVQTSSSQTNITRDIQFLFDVIQRTVSLKLVPDIDQSHSVNLFKFKHLRILHIDKVNIKNVLGIHKLRSQLQQLTCTHCLSNLGEVLDKCGGDNSQKYSWSELRKAVFSYNSLTSLDSSFECTPWLQSIDLSYNKLSSLEFIDSLPNLKQLTVSYNKLEKVPVFKGQICNRLQILIISNNFIEDLSNLSSLTNLEQLDLNQNCLLDHKTLLSISHLSTLQLLSLQGNPITYHPQHRNITSNYLNKNATTLKFVLDNKPLNAVEKSLTGTFYPMSQVAISSTRFNNSLESSNSRNSSLISEGKLAKKIRNVKIREENAKERKKVSHTPSPSSQHLEIKKQVEQLRKEYGESWLYRDSGSIVQDVLGFDKTSVLSSTPLEASLNALYVENTSNKTSEVVEASASSFNDSPVYSSNSTTAINEEESDLSDNEDVYLGGEEGIFLANPVIDEKNNDETDLFIVLTTTHISERDAITSKERARWHLNTVVSCEKLDNGTIKIVFDTLRRDRKQRIYKIEDDETFCNKIQEKIKEHVQVEKMVVYQCMKCNEKIYRKGIDGKKDNNSFECPKCNSNLIVETS